MDGVRFTHHAVDRYIERLRPALTRRLGAHELEALVERVGVLSPVAPAWYFEAATCDAFLLLGDDVVLPLALAPSGWVALTLITRGSLPPTVRAARNRSNAARRFRRHCKPRPQGRPQVAVEALAPAHGGAW